MFINEPPLLRYGKFVSTRECKEVYKNISFAPYDWFYSSPEVKVFTSVLTKVMKLDFFG